MVKGSKVDVEVVLVVHMVGFEEDSRKTVVDIMVDMVGSMVGFGVY